MKSHLLLLALATFSSLLSVSLTGCAGGYYSPSVYYAPAPSIVPVIGWGGIGFYGGSYGNNGGYYRGNSSWGGNSGYWRH